MAIAIPWYWLAVLRNPGFLWDSVVNQPLLRFFNEELPRDFVPDSLGFVWAIRCPCFLRWHSSSACFSPMEPPGGRTVDGRGP